MSKAGRREQKEDWRNMDKDRVTGQGYVLQEIVYGLCYTKSNKEVVFEGNWAPHVYEDKGLLILKSTNFSFLFFSKPFVIWYSLLKYIVKHSLKPLACVYVFVIHFYKINKIWSPTTLAKDGVTSDGVWSRTTVLPWTKWTVRGFLVIEQVDGRKLSSHFSIGILCLLSSGLYIFPSRAHVNISEHISVHISYGPKAMPSKLHQKYRPLKRLRIRAMITRLAYSLIMLWISVKTANTQAQHITRWEDLVTTATNTVIAIHRDGALSIIFSRSV